MFGHEVEKATEDRIFGAGASGRAIQGGYGANVNQCVSESDESLRSKAQRTADSAARDLQRHATLSAKLTPEIETALWCLQEAIALGLIELPKTHRPVERY